MTLLRLLGFTFKYWRTMRQPGRWIPTPAGPRSIHDASDAWLMEDFGNWLKGETS